MGIASLATLLLMGSLPAKADVTNVVINDDTIICDTKDEVLSIFKDGPTRFGELSNKVDEQGYPTCIIHHAGSMLAKETDVLGVMTVDGLQYDATVYGVISSDPANTTEVWVLGIVPHGGVAPAKVAPPVNDKNAI